MLLTVTVACYVCLLAVMCVCRLLGESVGCYVCLLAVMCVCRLLSVSVGCYVCLWAVMYVWAVMRVCRQLCVSVGCCVCLSAVMCVCRQFLTAVEFIYFVSYSSHFIFCAMSLRQWSENAVLLFALPLPVGLYKEAYSGNVRRVA